MICASSARHASVCGLQSWGSWQPLLPPGPAAARTNARIIHMIRQRGDDCGSERRTDDAAEGWNQEEKKGEKKRRSCRALTACTYFHQGWPLIITIRQIKTFWRLLVTFSLFSAPSSSHTIPAIRGSARSHQHPLHKLRLSPLKWDQGEQENKTCALRPTCSKKKKKDWVAFKAPNNSSELSASNTKDWREN